MTSPATRRLKEATADLHEEAERHVRILDPDATGDTYRRYIERMYGFHAGVERVFAEHPALAAAGFEPAARRKEPWLAADLRALGADPGALPLFRAERLRCADDLPRAVGVAYVLEGSTLGGRFILSRMRERLGHLTGVATRFLEGYREETGPRWRRYCALADDVLTEDGAVTRAIAGARDTFEVLVEWLDEPARDPPHPWLTTGATRR